MAAVTDTVEIENMVASTGIDQELDLESVGLELNGADYDPDNFPELVHRTQDTKGAALIFQSGKVVCTGASSAADVHDAIEIVFDELRSGSRSTPPPSSPSRISSPLATSVARSFSMRLQSALGSRISSTSLSSSRDYPTGLASPSGDAAVWLRQGRHHWW